MHTEVLHPRKFISNLIRGNPRRETLSSHVSIADFEEVSYNAGEMNPEFLSQPQAEELIARDKFKRYVEPIVPSLEHVSSSHFETGDLYFANRKNGEAITIAPYYIDNFSTEQGFRKDWLLVLAYDEDKEVVGTRSVYLTFQPDAIRSNGFISSAICGEGIAGTVEAVRGKTMQELMGRYQLEGAETRSITHQIEDDNINVLTRLNQRSHENPRDIFLAKRYDHARSDRPRWESLFNPDSTKGINENLQIIISPSEASFNQGFSADPDKRTAFLLRKSITGTYQFVDIGPEQRNTYQAGGLFDKEFVVQQLQKSIAIPSIE